MAFQAAPPDTFPYYAQQKGAKEFHGTGVLPSGSQWQAAPTPQSVNQPLPVAYPIGD